MEDSWHAAPRYVGGSVAEHVLFVVALCRFQHHSLPLSLIHYATWSVMHVGLYAIALTLSGPVGAGVLAACLSAWAVRMDVRVGLLFGVMEFVFLISAKALIAGSATSVMTSIGIALGGIVGALVVEVAGHLLVQGYPPGPPARAVAALAVREKAAFVPYFVVTYGLFFLTLDLAMRLTGYRPSQHGRANAIAAQWHAEALGEPAGVRVSRESNWHRRAIAELS